MNKIIKFFNNIDIGDLMLFSLLILVVGLFIGLIVSETTEYRNQKIVKNYILHTNVTILNRPKECDNLIQCKYKTSIGVMLLEDNIFRNFDNNTKFDIGINLGTCYSMLYIKVYTNDVLDLFYLTNILKIKHDTDQYKYYTNLLKVKPSFC